jgi:hypothetical protein
LSGDFLQPSIVNILDFVIPAVSGKQTPRAPVIRAQNSSAFLPDGRAPLAGLS